MSTLYATLFHFQTTPIYVEVAASSRKDALKIN